MSGVSGVSGVSDLRSVSGLFHSRSNGHNPRGLLSYKVHPQFLLHYSPNSSP